MVIRRQNFVATLIEKLLKKNVAMLFCSVVTMIKKIAVEFVSTIKFVSDNKKLQSERFLS